MSAQLAATLAARGREDLSLARDIRGFLNTDITSYALVHYIKAASSKIERKQGRNTGL